MELKEMEQQVQLLVVEMVLVHGLISMEIFGCSVVMDIIILLVSF